MALTFILHPGEALELLVLPRRVRPVLGRMPLAGLLSWVRSVAELCVICALGHLQTPPSLTPSA